MKLHAASLIAAVALSACASYGPPKIQPGDDVDDLIRQMGKPTARYDMPDGKARVEYARGPYGKHTWMIDVDAENHVLGVEQVLTEKNFDSVKAGISSDEMLRKLGRPSERRSGGYQGGTVWSYRYDAIFCQWWQASVNDQGIVWDVAYGPDPLCEEPPINVSRRYRSKKAALAATEPLT